MSAFLCVAMCRSILAKAATVLLVLAVTASGGAAQTAVGSTRSMILSGPAFDAALLAEVNQVRARHGLRPFAADTRLTGAAQRHAGDMAHTRRMEHEIAGRPSFSARIRASGARIRTAGENILRSDLSRYGAGCSAAAAAPVQALKAVLARDSVQRWMGSPKHRESILNPRFQRMGSGFAVVSAPDGCGQIYVAQVFGG